MLNKIKENHKSLVPKSVGEKERERWLKNNYPFFDTFQRLLLMTTLTILKLCLSLSLAFLSRVHRDPGPLSFKLFKTIQM